MNLPSWYVLGAPKAGTTALADQLRMHPGACVAQQKEISFFNTHFDLGPQWLSEQFDAQPGQRCGDATPAYMYEPTSLDRIRDLTPDARLIVLLREPAARAWSHASYFQYLGLDIRDPETTLRAELADPSLTVPGFPEGYLSMSRYSGWLEFITARFHREQLLVLFSEDLRNDRDAAWERICTHLEMEVTPAPEVESNQGRTARSIRAQRLIWLAAPRIGKRASRRLFALNTRAGSYPKMPDDLSATLRAEFAPEMRAVAEWLGRPVPARWTTS